MEGGPGREWHDELPYLVFPPVAPNADEDRPPLIIFLHGRRESDPERSLDSLEKLTEKALPRLAATGKLPEVRGGGFPFLIVAPQATGQWTPDYERLAGFAEAAVERHGADPARCYLTGISMGAVACWAVARRARQRFAALLPVSGRIPSDAREVRDVPAWVFAGGHDKHYPAKQVHSEVADLLDHGAELTLSVDPGAVHDGSYWNRIYARRCIYEWLLEHRL